MRLLLLYPLISLVFSQEFTVQGNLNVSGNIQNNVIDSLKQVIQDLENDVNLLQNGVGNKFLELTFDGDYGYSLNSDVITFGDEQETTRHGKDLDKLDGPE